MKAIEDRRDGNRGVARRYQRSPSRVRQPHVRLFQCLIEVPGLRIEPEAHLDIAGWTLSQNREIDHIEETEASSGVPCWAGGQILARPGCVEQSGRSWVDHMMMNVLRLFLDPPPDDPWTQALSAGEAGAFFFTSAGTNEWKSGGDGPGPSARPTITAGIAVQLESSDAFRRASQILGDNHATPLQKGIMLAILQWGETTRVGPREIQLRSFLSVLDCLFDLESHEDGLDLAARLICRREQDSLRVERVKESLDELYIVRDRILHDGCACNSVAPSVLRAGDLYTARHFTRHAIINALLFHYDTHSKRDLVRELKEVAG